MNMQIANPIYDVVFKFMMEDNKVAKAFLSAIIQEEVVKLDFASQEHTARVAGKRKKAKTEAEVEIETTQYTVCRFDFSARIALPGGKFKTVMIELQKAKLSSDIMRFRRYLGIHYQNPDNAYGEGKRKARQIYCIFLLGYDIGVPGRPVLRVDNCTTDIVTNEDVVIPSNEFIEGLHHRSWIVQLDQLKRRRRNDLEKLLSIFDQRNRSRNHHFMKINEEDFPEMYRPIIRRLLMAGASEDIQNEMEVEDDFLAELQDRDRTIEQVMQVNKEQKKVIGEKDQVIEEKDQTIAKLTRQLAEMRRQAPKA